MKKLILALGIVFLFATCKKDVPQKQLIVKVTPEVGGSVTPNSGTYAMGSSVKLTATPSAEYVFKEWTGGFTGTTNPANVIMDADKTITAVFEKREYPLSLTIVGSGTVKEEIIKIASTATNYKSGTTVRLTPQPSDFYIFKGWSGDNTSNTSPLEIVVSKPINLTCTFEKEDSLKFSSNLDSMVLSNLNETLQLKIGITSKMPTAGLNYSIQVNWLDNSTQIFKVDTSTNVSSLNLNLNGFKNVGNYSISVTITSKSNSKNTINKVYSGTRCVSWVVDSIFTPFPNQVAQFKNARMQGRMIFFNRNNIENFIVGGAQWFGNTNHILYPPLWFNKPAQKWNLVQELSTVDVSDIRNWRFLEDGSGFVITETGPEWPDIPWPFGNMYVARFQGSGLSWTKVNQNKSFYHDVAAGDINGDGIIDIVGSHLGTRDGNNDNPHIYLGKSDGSFQELVNVLPTTPSDYDDAPSGGDVEIYDIDGDGQNEIINFGAYPNVYSIQYNKYDKVSKLFNKKLYFKGDNPMNIPTTYDDSKLKFNNLNNFKGYMPVGKRFQDFNNDSKMDFISESDGMTIWYGQGNSSFMPVRVNTQGVQDPLTQLPIFPNYNMSGYQLIDLESDGDPDVIPYVLNFGNKNNLSEIDLSRMIFLNDNGTMRRLSSTKYKVTKSQMGGNTPDNLMPFIRNGKLCFGGYLGMTSYPEFNFTLYVTISTNISASYWYK
jgi:hypothetical protein